MKKKIYDFVLAFFITASLFLGILILDNYKDLGTILPFILFLLTLVLNFVVIKFVKFVFKIKWQ